MIKTFIATTILFIQVVAGAQTAAQPTFKVGDQWEWSTIDSLTKIEASKTKLTIVEIGSDIRLASDEDTKPSTTWTLDGLFLQDARTGRKVAYKTPYRPWPLEVGKKWDAQTEWVSATGQSGRTKQDAAVVAYEEVTVPAGKFMAYKIEMKGFFNNVSSGHNGRQSQTVWYAPEAGTAVRLVYDDGFNRTTTQLTSMARK